MTRVFLFHLLKNYEFKESNNSMEVMNLKSQFYEKGHAPVPTPIFNSAKQPLSFEFLNNYLHIFQ